tara:strand:+ start:313 stop:606 length:294 start_codon:yes stop_codon:yes gene_type:complete
LSNEASVEIMTQTQLEHGFFNHTFMPSPKGGPFFCVWEAKENLTIEDLQTFIDGPNGVNMGLSALHNIIYQLDTALTGGQVPFDNNSPYLGFTDTAQ